MAGPSGGRPDLIKPGYARWFLYDAAQERGGVSAKGQRLSSLIIFLPTFGMFGDPLGGSFFGSEALDYFRLTIGPKNVYHPTESGVAFRRCEGGPMLGHIPNMHLPGVGSSRLTDEYDKAPEREVSARGPRT